MIAQTIGSNEHPSIIKAHHAAQSFSPRRVAAGTLLRLLEAARWTSSYRNEQPWSFIITSKEDTAAYERLLSCLPESNVGRARRAPVLILSVVKLNFDGDGRRNPYAFHDAGKAAANLTHRAAAMGLLVHQMGGFDATSARQLFSIPVGYSPVSVIAIGYPESEGSTDNPGVDETLMRRPLQNLVFAGRWGQATTLLHALRG